MTHMYESFTEQLLRLPFADGDGAGAHRRNQWIRRVVPFFTAIRPDFFVRMEAVSDADAASKLLAQHAAWCGHADRVRQAAGAG